MQNRNHFLIQLRLSFFLFSNNKNNNNNQITLDDGLNSFVFFYSLLMDWAIVETLPGFVVTLLFLPFTTRARLLH